MFGSSKVGWRKHPGFNNGFFDDVLGFDPNGGGIHDTFVGKILDNPIVSTVLKFTPAAPLSWGYDAGSAAGAGKWGKAVLSGLGAYGSLGGFGSGASSADAAFAASDAAQLAEQGISASQISDILGSTYGMDAVTASMLGQNAFLGQTPQELAKFTQSLGGYGDWGMSAAPYDPSVAASINPQLKLSTELSGLGGTAAAPIPGMSSTLSGGPLGGGFESLQSPDFGLNNLKLSTNLGGGAGSLGDMPVSLANLGKYSQLGQTGSSMSGAPIASQPGQAPVEERTDGTQTGNNPNYSTTAGSGLKTLFNSANDALVNPIKQGMQGLVSWSGGSLPQFGDLDTVDLLSGGINTIGALDAAGDLKKQAGLSDIFAGQRADATSRWNQSYNDPESLWNEYIQGPGAKYLKEGAARMAQAGNRGQLPMLMTQARQDFYNNYLPNYRQQTNPSVFNSQPNAQLYSQAASAKQNAYNQIPSMLNRIFTRKYTGKAQ